MDMKKGTRDAAGRYLKGRSGNPAGRKPGSVDKRTKYRQAFAANADALITAVVKSALEGDTTAQRLCLERITPPLKSVDMPVMLMNGDSLADQGRVVLQAVANGDITPNEGEAVFHSLTAQARITELSELDKRIEALERAAV
jgi:hypothetical protein